MDDCQGSSSSLPPFLSKTYEMVDDSSSDSIVSWSETNKSFIVWNPPEFARDLLPRYFKHNNFSSFIRQLNTYGFRKIDPEKWEFANDDFIRGKPNLLRNIHRRKAVHSHSVQNVQTQGTISPLTELERQRLKDDIERLKKEKESILSEVEKHEEERAELNLQIRSLKDRFYSIEQRHRSMVSNLADVLQKPGLALTLLFESEPNDRKRRLPRLGYLQDEGSGEESSIGTSQNLNRENSEASYGLISIMDLYDQLEASLTIWENIMSDVRQTFEQRVINSNNLELEEATSCTEVSDIDMNSEPAVAAASELPGPAPPKEQEAANPVPPGVNDNFWAQFLTENPGSSETQEAQSERKDKIEGKSSSDRRYWLSVKTVSNLTEQMGHLTPAERT